MTRLRLVFMGTPAFAVPALAALIDAGHGLAAVYSRAPRPAGRGQRTRPSPLHAFAEERGIDVRTPAHLGDAAERDAFAGLGADAAVVVAYGLILPKVVLDAPRLSCINVHASLLPRWRGAAPMERAIMAGDAETGVTIMRLDEGLDTGPMLAARPIAIGPRTTVAELHDDLARIGAALLVETLDGLAAGRLAPMPQPDDGVTVAAKIGRDEFRLDWRRPAVELDRIVRALAPRVWFAAAAGRIRVAAARDEPAPAPAPPGTVLDARPAVACGEGVLVLERLQRPGKAPLDGAAFLRGHALPAGTVLE